MAAPETDFTADPDALLACVTERTRILFLANPNNPTGTYVSRAALRRLWSRLPENVLLVLDAAYAEFVSAPDYDSGFELAEMGRNVVTTRTFSKIYGLAALRLGWAYGAPAVIDVLNRVRGPFNANGAALAAALAALDDTEHVLRAREHADAGRAAFAAQMRALGLAVVPSVCNFVLLGFPAEPGRDAAAAERFLAERGILVRDMKAYGLPGHLRVTVGLETEMAAAGSALEDFAAAAPGGGP